MYNKTTHFHFMGIGGIGMSGIAKILIQQGYNVSGCDKNIEQKSILDLKKLGCSITNEHNSDICHNISITVLVYSTDIANDNPEFIYAQSRNIPIVHRSIILAEIMRDYHAIGVAGSHGKTTTTSLISHIFLEANYDPTIIVGGYLERIQSNAHYGSGQFLIAETDESDRSLLNLRPTFAVLTTIDIEHMNVYKNLHDITTTFATFLNNLPFYGKAFVCIDDKQIQSLLPLSKAPYVTYGLSEHADWQLDHLKLEKDKSSYTIHIKSTHEYYPVTVALPGEHNALNSLVALMVAYETGIPLLTAIDSLAYFTGVDRRFTYRGIYKNIEIFDDYGHHPTEITCTIKNAIRRAEGKPVTVIFQPHRYTRTQSLWKDFITAFIHTSIDHLIITDLYSAGEQPLENISSNKLAEEISKLNPTFTVAYVPYEDNHVSLIKYLSDINQNSGLLLLQGAGTVTKISQSLL